jgi:hypothetical protein
MYQPFIRQKNFEVRASELERIAEEDRIAREHAADAPPRRWFKWSRPRSAARRPRLKEDAG